MKKYISALLVLVLLVTTAAFASESLSFKTKSGQYGKTVTEKNTSTGTSGSVTVISNPNGHSMYYQIHKANGGAATVYRNTTGTGTYSLSYNKDGNGNSLGRNGYEYRLRVAHRRQCKCEEGTKVTVEVDFKP